MNVLSNLLWFRVYALQIFQAVVEIGKDRIDTRGVEAQYVMSEFWGKCRAQDVQKAIDFLSDEGHITTTIDAHHYIPTSIR